MSSIPFAELDNRSRWSVIALITAIAGAGWLYLIYMEWAMANMHLVDMWMPPQAGARAWSAYDLLMLLLMWVLMMAAMMLPSSLPMALIYASIRKGRLQKKQPTAPVVLLIAGYVGAWSVYSLAVSVLQWWLHESALLNPMMDSRSYLLSGLILIGAGLYQWTPAKQACLNNCRSPLGFFMTSWRDGYYGTFRMGLHHGLYCTGCCWALMAILFAVGVMNMLWIVVLALFVLLEKTLLPPVAGRIVTGIALIVWGGWWLSLYLWQA